MKKMSITKRVKEYFIEYTTYIFDSDKKTVKNGVHDKKSISNLARARREIIELIRLNLIPNSCLLTLTYKENMQDYEKSRKDFKKFVMRLEYNFNISLRYLRVIELQERGAIHFHVIIFNSEFVNISYNEIYRLWGHGAVHIRKIENLDDVTADKVGNYLGKYLTKSKDIAVNRKIYTTSRNLKRLEKERIIINDESLFNYYNELYMKNTDMVITIDEFRMKKYIKSK